MLSIVRQTILATESSNNLYRNFVAIHPVQIKSSIARLPIPKALEPILKKLIKIAEIANRIAPNILSAAANFIPYVGQAKMLVEAIIGKDLITGDELKGWQRVLNVVPLAVKPCSIMLKGLSKVASKTVTAGIQSTKVTPALAIFLKVSTVTPPTPIVKLIDEIAVVGKMNAKVFSTAASEVAQTATGVIKMSQSQLNAIKVIKEGIDKLEIINSVTKNISKSSPILSAGNSKNNQQPPISIPAKSPAIVRRRRETEDVLNIISNEVFWVSRNKKLTVYITKSDQLIGSYRSLGAFVEKHPEYSNWDKHHIVEDIHLENLGIRNLYPGNWEDLPCVLLPKVAHSQRMAKYLRAADSLKLGSRAIYNYYKEAYRSIGSYTGKGSESDIARELNAIVEFMLELK